MSLEYKGYDFIISGRSKTPVFRKIDESGKPKLIKTATVPEEVKSELMRRYEAQHDIQRAEEAKKTVEEVKSVESVDYGEPAEVIPDGMENVELEELRIKVQKAEKALTELLPMTVFEATLEQLAKEMSNRFGVYTVFIGREPEDGDVHPISAELMNMYERGLAYKQYVKATLTGKVENLPEPVEPQRINVPRTYEIDQDAKWRSQGMQSNVRSESNKAASYGIDGIVPEQPIGGEGMVAQTIIDPSWQNKGMPIEYLKDRDGLGR